jgi:hypothetical protein
MQEEQGEDSHDEEDEKGRQETILSLFLDVSARLEHCNFARNVWGMGC